MRQEQDDDDEWALVDSMRRQASTSLPAAAVGPGDDAAVISWGGGDLVLTTDCIAEGTHFHPDQPPEAIGRFAATVNLSDLAAMGAEPRGLLAACAAPRTAPGEWFRGVARGLLEGLDGFGCPLLGGDTKTAPARFVAGTAIGSVPAGGALVRSGARAGDALVATGRFGGPGAALALLREGRLSREEAMGHVFDVKPRIQAGSLLRESGAHAAVDTSDGLARGAVLLARQSRLSVEVDLDVVPVHPLVEEAMRAGRGDEGRGESGRGREAWCEVALATGGEYELLAAVDPGDLDSLTQKAAQIGVSLTRVGSFRAGTGARGTTSGKSIDLQAMGWRQR